MNVTVDEKTLPYSETKKHPAGLYLCSFTIMWERFSYYGMRGILMMYLIHSMIQGGLGLDKAEAVAIYSSLISWVYFTPLIGGYLSDKFFGEKLSIMIGSVLIALGNIALFTSPTKTMLWTGLILIIAGNGFFKPNMNNMVGNLYEKNDPRKDAAYSIYYAAINMGSLVAPLVCGGLAEKYLVKHADQGIIFAYKYGFLAASIGMIIGGVAFILLQNKYLKGIGEFKGLKKSEANKNAKVQHNEPLTSLEKKRVGVILLLGVFIIAFWTAFEQTGSSLTIYINDYVVRNVGGFEVPVSWFQSINPFFCVLFGPIVGWFWVKLARKRNKDVSVANKMALGLFLMGVGFLFMVGASLARGNSTDVTIKVSMMWIILSYLFQTIGELCLSPVGISMVNKLAPVKFASLIMGVWLLNNFFAGYLSGLIASKVESLGPLTVFGTISVVMMVLGFILLVVNKKIESVINAEA